MIWRDLLQYTFISVSNISYQDIAGMLLKLALNTIQSINQSIKYTIRDIFVNEDLMKILYHTMKLFKLLLPWLPFYISQSSNPKIKDSLIVRWFANGP